MAREVRMPGEHRLMYPPDLPLADILMTDSESTAWK